MISCLDIKNVRLTYAVQMIGRQDMSVAKKKEKKTMNRNEIISQLAKILANQNLISDAERLKLLKIMKEG